MSELIFGYTWEQIKRAQQGGRLADFVIGESKPVVLHPSDLELYKKLGMKGLKEKQLYGVIDRLNRSGILKHAEEDGETK